MPSEIRNEYALLIKKSRGTKETCMADTEMKYRFRFIHNTLMTFSKSGSSTSFPSAGTVSVTLCHAYILFALAKAAQVQWARFVILRVFVCSNVEFSRVIMNCFHLCIWGFFSPGVILWIALQVTFSMTD